MARRTNLRHSPLWKGLATGAALSCSLTASAGLIGDTVQVFGFNTPGNAVYIDQSAIVGAGTEFDVCTVRSATGDCLLRLEIDFTDDSVTTRTTSLSPNTFAISAGVLAFGDLDGGGPLQQFLTIEDEYRNNPMCVLTTNSATCTYNGYRLPPGVALQSVGRFVFSSVPNPAPGKMLLFSVCAAGAARTWRRARDKA